MSKEAHIEQAMRQAFLTALPGAVGKTAFENAAFDPQGLAKWFRFHHLPNRAEVATLGSSGLDLYSGVTQIDILVKAGQGRGDIDADIEALRNAFTPRLRIVYLTADVIIEARGSVPGEAVHDSFYTYTFSIQWRSYTSPPS